MSNLPGGKLLGTVFQFWDPCFGIWVDFLAEKTIELETKVQNQYYTLWEELYNSLKIYRIVVAYKKPTREGLLHPSVYMPMD